MILTVEIDGTSLQAHEFYGSPFIALWQLASRVFLGSED